MGINVETLSTRSARPFPGRQAVACGDYDLTYLFSQIYSVLAKFILASSVRFCYMSMRYNELSQTNFGR